VAVSTRPRHSTTGHSSAPPAKPVDRAFRPDVQGLRAIAVGMVVIYHLHPPALPGGFAGVDVFFVISGFLITSHLARGFARTGRIRLLDFWGRRARRLLPAAAVVLTATWVVSRWVLPATQLPATAEQIRGSALYYQNWILAHDAVDYLTSADAPSPVQHFWSLSVEEQFYLVWPFVFVLAAVVGVRHHRRAGRMTALALAGAIFVASLWYSAHLTVANPPAAYFVTTTRMWELAMGGLIALLPGRLAALLAKQGWLAWIGLAMVVASAFVLSGTSPFPGTVALLPVGGAALLIACGSAAAVGGPAALLSVRPMVFLGDISYSLYLWHWPIIVLWKAHSGPHIGYVDGPAIAAVSIALAWLSKVYVEDTVRQARVVTARPWRSLATVVTVLIPVGLVALYTPPKPYQVKIDATHPGAATLASPRTSAPTAPPRPTAAQAPEDYSHFGDCQTPIVGTRLRTCVVGDTHNYTLTVAIAGDSVADQWRTPIQEMAKQRHWRVVVELHGECPWTATMTAQLRTSDPYPKCQIWGKNVLDGLVNTYHPDVLVTSARPVLGTPSHSTPDATSFGQIADGMVTYWRRLAAHGTRIIAIKESPEPGRNVPDCLSRPGATPQNCATPLSRAIVKKSPLEQAVAKSGGLARLIDMNSLICGPQTCNPIVGNVIVYRDTHHLTLTYIDTLRPYFQRKLLATGDFDKPHWKN
jgi:peptidoglycan/LPS O-acetylase OafA/YrhL